MEDTRERLDDDVTASPPTVDTSEDTVHTGEDTIDSHGAAPPTKPPVARGSATAACAPAERIGDFELLRVLGKGAFAQVYLARQISLDRLVAVKLSANVGSEARTLASLEHDHIVHVFLEMILPERKQRLLCMQYVAGCTLHEIIRALAGRTEWDGHSVLEIIDQRTLHPPAMDPAALRDRELLDDCTAVEAVCFMGARLAEALAYAHRRGVLHRDVKPANVLVNPFGRPMLADFNIACDARDGEDGSIGGTPTYMAPEHLDALCHRGEPKVDERSDIYGLALVLFELLTGTLPFPRLQQDASMRTHVCLLADQRRTGTGSARQLKPAVPHPVDRALRRCLEPDPAARFAQASDLAQTLDGCRELAMIERELPPPWPFPRMALTAPFLMLAVLILVPQLASSLVNIAYNGTQIVGSLSTAQHAAFARMVIGYNALIYPVCLALLYRAVQPVYRTYTALERLEPLPAGTIDAARARVLTWTTWVTVISSLGWLPGAVIFPLGISLLSEPVGARIYSHFIVSLAMSGVIAVTYSFFGVQFIAHRVLYLRLWEDTRHVRRRIHAELSRRTAASKIFKLLAGTIPLTGAILLLGAGPEMIGLQSFRLLVAALIMMGMVGLMAAVFAGDLLARTHAALLGR